MTQLAPLDDWWLHLGRLLSNFQSFELVLRCFVFERATVAKQRLPLGSDLYASPVGSQVLLNALTDHRSLAQLIAAYNAVLPKTHAEWAVDPAIVATRDAITHGRISASVAGADLRLIKFARPAHKSDTHVTVTVNVLATLDWLKGELGRLDVEFKKAHLAHVTLHKPRAS